LQSEKSWRIKDVTCWASAENDTAKANIATPVSSGIRRRKPFRMLRSLRDIQLKIPDAISGNKLQCMCHRYAR